jgi:LCP family protein required for cell wall assembly
MASADVAVRPGRSAFAAAFLSFIFPGLGHAYLGRWLRALAWAALPLLGIAGFLGLGFSAGFTEMAAQLLDPDVLMGVLVFLGIDLLYRLIALLDAWRLASDPTVGSAASRTASMAGLAALIVVLVGSHVAVAQPVFFATDTINEIAGNAGDDSEVLTQEQLVELGGADFDVTFDETLPPETAAPTDAPAAVDEATLEPTDAPTETPTEEPEDTASLPEWNGKERLNILLIGSDGGRQGRASNSLLTDTMITVSVDPATGRVAFISLPRDASNIPLPRGKGWNAGGTWNNKINTLYAIARSNPARFPGNDKERGYKALMGALGQLYGLDIKYYVSVDLNSFRAVVNTLGGVIVDVQNPVYDPNYPTDDGRGKLKLYVQPGMRQMNGQQALAYARSRHGSSDFDRSARQQRVITSVRDQTDIGEMLANPQVITRLINQMRKDVKTNIPPKLVPKLLSLAREIDLDRRENLVLSSSAYVTTCYPCPPSGLFVLRAKPGPIKSAVRNIFSLSKAQARQINKIEAEGAVVHIRNGEGGRNQKAINIASNLRRKGLAAVVPPIDGGRADSNDYKNTVIRFYNGAEESMPQTAARIRRTFKDKQKTVEFIEDPAAIADVEVIVGKKTESLRP